MSATILLALRVLMALALYTFLGVIVVTLWRDLYRQTQATSVQTAREIILNQSVNGGNGPLHFTVQKINIGRDPACELIVDDSTVSARHASLTFRQGHWWLEDLGSKNGTFINGQLLEVPMVITDGDVVMCGGVEFNISLPVTPDQPV